MNKKAPYDLAALADQIMKDKGLAPEFSLRVFEQLETIQYPAAAPSKYEDLRSLLWCSIDNDDSRDLDQLTYAKKAEDGLTTIWIAVADVDALVSRDCAVDNHAKINTTSVYTPAKIFPMLPEKLSTNLTSLNENEDRVAMVTRIKVGPKGDIQEGTIFQALVHNYAQLTYRGVGAWLEGKSAIPEKIAQVPGLEAVLQCQHEVTQLLRAKRHAMGALTLQSSEAEAKVVDSEEIKLELPAVNPATQLIEHFMIAANSVMANYFLKNGISSFRRIVRIPKRWDRIVKIAADLGVKLPKDPDSKALDRFLVDRKAIDPETFPDLSLTIIKLLGRGEYAVEKPNQEPEGHFGLALTEYTHSTAPNRRYPDLIAQRQCKALINGQESPYSPSELQWLSKHCSEQEDTVNKLERQMRKSAEALYLSSYIGTKYKGVITGAAQKGTWVRIFQPPVEGKLISGFQNLDVGDRVTVKLVGVDIVKGYIDFEKV